MIPEIENFDLSELLALEVYVEEDCPAGNSEDPETENPSGDGGAGEDDRLFTAVTDSLPCSFFLLGPQLGELAVEGATDSGEVRLCMFLAFGALPPWLLVTVGRLVHSERTIDFVR